MKRLITLLVAFCFILSGCRGPETYKTISFATWGSKTEIAIIKSVIDDFELKNPDIKINLMHIPQNYFQKIHLLFASNTEPDIIFINNLYLPVYANSDKLLELKPDISDYNEKILKALSWKGKYYAIPRDISLLVIYYNKDIFKRYGIKEPEPDWTSDDFFQKTLEIKEKTGKFAISFEDDALFYLPYIMSNGGDFIKADEKAQQARQFYIDLAYKYNVAPRKDQSASMTMAQMFLNGDIVMHLTGRWLYPKYKENAKFEIGAVTFPKGIAGSIVSLDGSGWAVSKSSKNKDTALKFIEFLSSKDTIEKFTQTGLIIPARADVLAENSDVYSEALKTALPTSVTVDYNKVLDKRKQELMNMIQK